GAAAPWWARPASRRVVRRRTGGCSGLRASAVSATRVTLLCTSASGSAAVVSTCSDQRAVAHGELPGRERGHRGLAHGAPCETRALARDRQEALACGSASAELDR